ncbi:MAG: hypothetical protein Q4G60_03910 [bacterium]|nr:hypothetical protein [bacterium]
MDDKNGQQYCDIIDLPHHVSEIHPHMSVYDRAAQFAPFAALTGYEDATAETARLTDQKVELEEDKKEILDAKIRILQECGEQMAEVTLVYFVRDEKKAGGTYETMMDSVKRIDAYRRLIITKDGHQIPIDDMIDIQGDFESITDIEYE